MKNNFPERSTASKLKTSKIKEGSALHTLIEKLNCSTHYGEPDPEKSIMHYGQLCEHDDGFLCEDRLQFIVDFIKKNFSENEIKTV